MRLQFGLEKIRMDPSCHMQIARHAAKFQGRTHIYGQLYGALYEDAAEVTSVLPLLEGDKSTKEELEAMEKRKDESLTAFSMDAEKIGWYLVCFRRNFWDHLETIKYFEDYIETSFFLVFDDKARKLSRNPYRAFRLKDHFALQEGFSWAELKKCSPNDSPLQEIPVEIKHNPIFEAVLLSNKHTLFSELEANSRKNNEKVTAVKEEIDEYIEAFQEHEEALNELRNSEQLSLQNKVIPFSKSCQYVGQALKLAAYGQHFKEYQQDISLCSVFFKPQGM